MNRNGNGSNGHNGEEKPEAFDYLIVGAGYAGSILAERLARGSGKKALRPTRVVRAWHDRIKPRLARGWTPARPGRPSLNRR